MIIFMESFSVITHIDSKSNPEANFKALIFYADKIQTGNALWKIRKNTAL